MENVIARFYIDKFPKRHSRYRLRPFTDDDVPEEWIEQKRNAIDN